MAERVIRSAFFLKAPHPMAYEVKLAAHYNIDSHVLKTQIYIVSPCDDYMHPEAVLSGSVQVYNVYNLPETGLEEIPLESVKFDKNHANQDGYFCIFFINPAVTTNLEVRASVHLVGQGATDVVTLVLPDEGTFSDQPNTSIVGNAENRSWHLDAEPQRDAPFLDEAPHNIIEPVGNALVIPDPNIVQSVYEDIQFEQLAELRSSAVINGELVYIGGGGRLLPKPGVLVKQDVDEPPWELGTSTFTEQGAAQALDNNTYMQSNGNRPAGYIMDSSGITIIDSTVQRLQGEGFEANAWSVQVNGASPSNITPFSTASLGMETPIPFDVSKPIALSILAGLEKRAPESGISTAQLKLQFYDFADRDLTAKIVAIDPSELFNARPLKPFSIQALVSEYPPTTEKITWRLEIGEVHQGDYIVMRTALPSLTQTAFASSTVLSDELRLTDNLSYVPSSPLAAASGAIVAHIAIGFTGAPATKSYIFDTRDIATMQDGVALFVEPAGELSLLIDVGGTQTLLTTPSPVEWVSGQVFELVAEWEANLMRISVGGAVLAENASATLPPNTNTLTFTSVQLGANAIVQESLNSEFIRIVLLKRPR